MLGRRLASAARARAAPVAGLIARPAALWGSRFLSTPTEGAGGEGGETPKEAEGAAAAVGAAAGESVPAPGTAADAEAGGLSATFRARPASFSQATTKHHWRTGNQLTLQARRDGREGGWAGARVMPQDRPEPTYDPVLLKKLGIEEAPPWQIQRVLRDGAGVGDELSLEDLAMMVDAGLHMEPDYDDDPELQGVVFRRTVDDEFEEAPKPDKDTWGPEKMTQLLPKRKFFPGQTYEPKELSPHTPVNWSKLKWEFSPKSCPLGGKKGPKVDWTNAAALSRFLTEGGNIKPRRVSKVSAKKQKELARAVKRARNMGLLTRTSRVRPAVFEGRGGDDHAGSVYK